MLTISDLGAFYQPKGPHLLWSPGFDGQPNSVVDEVFNVNVNTSENIMSEKGKLGFRIDVQPREGSPRMQCEPENTIYIRSFKHASDIR